MNQLKILRLVVSIALLTCVSFVATQIHVGSSCGKHEDCIRYCAYSRHGIEGASCCFPEKIRTSKSHWSKTGSKTCYCCPLPQYHSLLQKSTTDNNVSIKIQSLMNIFDLDEVPQNQDSFQKSQIDPEPGQQKGKRFGGIDYCDFYIDHYDNDKEGTEQQDTEPGTDEDLEITQEFCSSRCVQVMINIKMGFEFPSLCRARKSRSS